jgi:hypothetical protein
VRNRIAAATAALLVAGAVGVGLAGPAAALSSVTVGAITNARGSGVLYVDDGGYCPKVSYNSGQPIGPVSTCRTTASRLRLEVYAVTQDVSWDPFTMPGGLQIEAAAGVNVGNLPLAWSNNGGIHPMGTIASATPVADGRLRADIFQVMNHSDPLDVGTFGDYLSANHGTSWTPGWVTPGQYVVELTDNATGVRIQGIMDYTPGANIDLDLDATCFGLDQCRYEAGGPPVTGGGFHPLTPFRVLDTRNGVGIANGPIGAGDGRNPDPNPDKRAATLANHELKVLGVGGVPASGVSAVILNVTAVYPTADGFLTLYPKLPRGVANPADNLSLFDDQSWFLPNYPNTSNLNFSAGEVVPNLVVARVGAGGKVRIENFAGQTDTVADVVGWIDTGAGGDGFFGVTPVRVLDTRTGAGGIGGRFSSGESRALTAAPSGGVVPADATAVVLNVTAAAPTNDGYVTVWPAGQPMPVASSLNTQAGQTRPNLVVAKVGTGGKVGLYVYGFGGGSSDLVADVVGYFRPGGGGVVGIDPQRLFDSRTGQNTRLGPFGPGEARAVQVAGQAGVPAGAKAAILNVTVTEPSFAGLRHRVADGRRHAARLEPQLRRRPEHPEPRDGDAGYRRPGLLLQLGRHLASPGRRGRLRHVGGDRRGSAGDHGAGVHHLERAGGHLLQLIQVGVVPAGIGGATHEPVGPVVGDDEPVVLHACQQDQRRPVVAAGVEVGPQPDPQPHGRQGRVGARRGRVGGGMDESGVGGRERDAQRMGDVPRGHLVVAGKAGEDREPGGVGRRPRVGA